MSYHAHFVQCSVTRLNNCLEEILQVYQDNDIVILLEDATFAVYTALAAEFKTVHVLSADVSLVQAQSQVQIIPINYDDLANLLTQAEKVFNWR